MDDETAGEVTVDQLASGKDGVAAIDVMEEALVEHAEIEEGADEVDTGEIDPMESAPGEVASCYRLFLGNLHRIEDCTGDAEVVKPLRAEQLPPCLCKQRRLVLAMAETEIAARGSIVVATLVRAQSKCKHASTFRLCTVVVKLPPVLYYRSGMETHIGLVLKGINNIYTVRYPDGAERLCRIKGKQLAHTEGEYNPIATGDWVEVTDDGQILARRERKSSFVRWNGKGLSNQSVAANMDQVLVVASVSNPPFRPRFLDRAIACVRDARVVLVLTKCDLGESGEDQRLRFDAYRGLGYPVVRVSSVTGEGLDELKSLLEGKVTALVGQSGVGKSTLVNVLCGSDQRIGEISGKYDRGRHTTNHAVMLFHPDYTLIDTPGVRELLPPHGDPHAIERSFPEFRDSGCLYPGCLHRDEPGCRVKELVEKGKILADRYESYLHMLDTLEDMAPAWVKVEKKMPKKKKMKYKDYHGDAE